MRCGSPKAETRVQFLPGALCQTDVLWLWSMSSKTFNLRYEIDMDFSVEDLWPDGDGPTNPTVEDVEALIKSCGGWDRILDDWGLVFEADKRVVDVTESNARILEMFEKHRLKKINHPPR